MSSVYCIIPLNFKVEFKASASSMQNVSILPWYQTIHGNVYGMEFI